MLKEITESKNRIIGLDILRTIAILLVLISHSRIFLYPLWKDLQFLSIGGFFGVELFFVLSGFLIGTILVKTIDRNNSLTKHELKDFWIRRWFRTLPNYYLALLINSVVYFYLTGKNGLEFKYFIFNQSFFYIHSDFFGESWSLAVEEWFYLLFPISLVFVKYYVKDKTNSLVITLMLFLSLIVIARIIFVGLYQPLWDKQVRKITFFRLDAIFWGVFFAYINFYKPNIWVLLKKYGLAIGSIIIAFSIYYFEIKLLPVMNTKEESFFSKTFYFDIINIGFGLTLPFFNSIKSIGYNYLSRMIVLISVISYSLYLYHYSFFIKAITHFYPSPTKAQSVIIYILFWIITFVFCTIVFCLYEKPFTSLRERFSKYRYTYLKKAN